VADEHILDGRRALVTGGSEGIGLAIVRVLAGLGAEVVVNHPPSGPGSEPTAAELPPGCETVEADVADAEAVAAMFDRLGDGGVLDILVNNAGVFARAELAELEEAWWDAALDVNLKGAFQCSREASKLFADSRCARIVNVASTAALTGSRRGVHYAASKGGMIAMTRSLALALAPRVTVNAVAPGMTRTRQPGRDARGFREAGTRIPLGRVAEPEDIADVVAFLAGPGGRYITGQTIVVDGGAVLGG
jgi:NAD(P)-dependent dehydrogenase (short-subunit alcohol dehydrogenase family)